MANPYGGLTASNPFSIEGDITIAMDLLFASRKCPADQIDYSPETSLFS